MAIRLLPFRQYNEHNVINLFAYDAVGAPAALSDPFTNGDNDAGVFVTITNGNMDLDPVVYETNSYLGKTDYPHIGRDQYPVVPLKYQAATGGQQVLGVTLKQTLTHDENGEKLLYYPQKALEMSALLTGQAVPVLTKGLVTLNETAVTSPGAGGVFPSPGSDVVISKTEAGKVSGAAAHTADSVPAGLGGTTVVGTCIASGQRISDSSPSTDYFAKSTDGVASTGRYWVVKVDV
jgi:hypothetical protein